jgi:hypothetical protein
MFPDCLPRESTFQGFVGLVQSTPPSAIFSGISVSRKSPLPEVLNPAGADASKHGQAQFAKPITPSKQFVLIAGN